jgi:FixJ family two-component response regulator
LQAGAPHSDEEFVNGTGLLVSVVDDDESVRESLPDLLAEFGFAVEAFSSAEEFLESGRTTDTRCLILDVSMPGMSGPELHRELVRRGTNLPVIFITAHADENLRPTLLAQGAVACLFKPFGEADLFDALQRAIARG